MARPHKETTQAESLAGARPKLSAKVRFMRTERITAADVHRVLFGARTPQKRTIDELSEGIRRYTRRRYGRD